LPYWFLALFVLFATNKLVNDSEPLVLADYLLINLLCNTMISAVLARITVTILSSEPTINSGFHALMQEFNKLSIGFESLHYLLELHVHHPGLLSYLCSCRQICVSRLFS
jgi:hypothetical protein